jgi:hypothetical protein
VAAVLHGADDGRVCEIIELLDLFSLDVRVPRLIILPAKTSAEKRPVKSPVDSGKSLCSSRTNFVMDIPILPSFMVPSFKKPLVKVMPLFLHYV